MKIIHVVVKPLGFAINESVHLVDKHIAGDSVVPVSPWIDVENAPSYRNLKHAEPCSQDSAGLKLRAVLPSYDLAPKPLLVLLEIQEEDHVIKVSGCEDLTGPGYTVMTTHMENAQVRLLQIKPDGHIELWAEATSDSPMKMIGRLYWDGRKEVIGWASGMPGKAPRRIFERFKPDPAFASKKSVGSTDGSMPFSVGADPLASASMFSQWLIDGVPPQVELTSSAHELEELKKTLDLVERDGYDDSSRSRELFLSQSLLLCLKFRLAGEINISLRSAKLALRALYAVPATTPAARVMRTQVSGLVRELTADVMIKLPEDGNQIQI